MKSLVVFLLLLNPSWAYIPRLATILDKATDKNGGRQGLIIERNVEIKDESLSCKETWYIAHADLMKVVVSGKDDGKPWKFEILYKDGKRQTVTVKGNLKTFNLSAEFYEPLLHYRSSRALLNRLVRLQILPTWAPRLLTEKEPPSQKSFVSLDRFKGTVSYSLGSKNTKNSKLPPHLWLQQDSFNIQKLRLASQVEVEFSDYRDHDPSETKELTQPELQTIQWNQSTVSIRTTSLKITSRNDLNKELKISTKDKAELPSQATFKEFYSRFR